MRAKYPHIFEDFENRVDVVYMSFTKDSAKIRGGDCNIPRPRPSYDYECNIFVGW
jgi:hypothetical protein